MYYLDLIGSGSGYYFGNGADNDSPIYDNANYPLMAWDADVYWVYGLIRNEPDNRALDQMICDELGINPSDFTDENIHLLEVAAWIWSTEHPQVDLYYCGEEIEGKKLRKKIARELLDNVKTHYVFDDMGDYECWPTSFLKYAMKLILEEDDND